MTRPDIAWTCRDRVLRPGPEPLIMGILNVTPDSFSDGGRHFDAGRAVAHGLQMAADGAAIIDVGGESTRPGAAEVPTDEEIRRVVPVIRELCRHSDAVVSVDTRKAAVAAAALDAGARIINDVSALTHDPAMVPLALRSGAGLVLMHMRGTPATMQADPHYADVCREVRDYLRERVATLAAAGIGRACCAIDPGIGFGKTLEHNLSLIAGMSTLAADGLPVVMGISRKSMIGALTGRPVEERLAGSLAALVFCVLNGAHVLRVHDVRESRDAVRVALALRARQAGAS